MWIVGKGCEMLLNTETLRIAVQMWLDQGSHSANTNNNRVLAVAWDKKSRGLTVYLEQAERKDA
jgi:hypothetical protein